jgi:hypothetical protein
MIATENTKEYLATAKEPDRQSETSSQSFVAKTNFCGAGVACLQSHYGDFNVPWA